MLRFKYLALVCAIGFNAFAQNQCFPIGKQVENRLAEDINFLASVELAGREPGTEGALMAVQYISSKFASMGLESVSESEYLQPFFITKEVIFGTNNLLIYKKDTFSLRTDYFPLQYSSNAKVSGKAVFVKFGIVAPELGIDDYEKFDKEDLEGNIFVMDVSSPDGVHPHSKYIKYHDLGERVDLAKQSGAKAVVFVNLEDNASDPSSTFRKIIDKEIPVIFVQNQKLAKKIRKAKNLQIKTELVEQKIEAYNVVGMINNGADETVVIGAHYDHLGWGGKSSLYKGKEPQLHLGADDNASGTAGMLEVMRNVKQRGDIFQRFNYAFIAFSGEEMGLLGSSYFVKHLPDRFGEIRYMLNFDMIGRMQNNELAINGVGTSPVWEELIEPKACNNLSIKTSESGVGPSDHTSFYYREVPVLHFFTGTHKDYHKPTDIAEKINYKGEIIVLSYVLSLMQQLETMEQMEFTNTKENTETAPRFTVTLGVMPDYMFDGQGMKIDGVTEGKPAAKAGMKAGDVVTQMGDVKVVDMMSYMTALSRYKKGDKVNVTYQRGEEKQTVKVQF